MKLSNIIHILFFLFITNETLANKKSFNFKNQKISIATPNSWQAAEKFLSSSLTLFGPYEDGRRPVIMITESNVHDYSLSKDSEAKNLNKFRQGRKDWLKKNKASLIKFYKYDVLNWKHVQNIHTTGYEYELLGLHYIEKNYFFKCNSELFHLSTLKTKEQFKKHGEQIDHVVKSINCETKKS